MIKQRTKTARATGKAATTNAEMVLNWDGIGRVLGVSYMTAKRWSKRDADLARCVRVFRQNYDPHMKCQRIYVFAFRAELEAYMRARPAIFQREKSAGDPIVEKTTTASRQSRRRAKVAQ